MSTIKRPTPYWRSHYDRRYKAPQSDFAGLEYNEELANADGMHFHFWVPRSTLREAVIRLRAAVADCKSKRDMVNWSWDWIPAEETNNE